MALNKLSPTEIKHKKKVGLFSDGGGLYVQVRKSTSNKASKKKADLTKSYIFRYTIEGRARSMGLGSFNSVDLDEARGEARKYRALVKRKIDPLQHNRRMASKDAADAAEDKSFRECAQKFIEKRKSEWKNHKSESQWRNTLETYANPVIGDMFVRDIERKHVLKILDPIWGGKTATANRVRQRIESVLDYATVREWRDQGANPAKWEGNLDKTYIKRPDGKKVKHLASLPYQDVPKFYELLKEQDALAALALRFIIITATRVGETRNGTWDEVDFETKKWTIPAARMKGGEQHEVPLSPEAIRILKMAQKNSHNKYIFNSHLNRPVGESTIRKVLQKHHSATVHGFRSSFRMWAAEQTSYPREVCETALAHGLANGVEAAYQRSKLFPKRQRLMDAWAQYCLNGNKTAKILPIKKSLKSAAR